MAQINELTSNANSQSELQALLQGKKAQNITLRSILERIKQVNRKFYGEQPVDIFDTDTITGKMPLRSELFGESEICFYLLEEIAKELNTVEAVF